MAFRSNELRIALAATTWAQFAVVGNPAASLLHAYQNTYWTWREAGTDGEWKFRLVCIGVVGVLACFKWESNRSFKRALNLWAAMLQGILLVAEGLLFAATVPPQTGVAYIPIGMFILRWGWVEYRDGY